MTGTERLEAVFAGQKADRTPILGGWFSAPEHIQAIAGATEQQYWENPREVSITAYRRLGADGLIGIIVPSKPGEYRIVDEDTFLSSAGPKGEKGTMNLEEALAKIDAMQIEEKFDFEQEYATFREELIRDQAAVGQMLWMPAEWRAVARVVWYDEFGYDNFFYLVGLYPDRMRKLIEIGGVWGYRRSRLISRAVQEGIYPRAVLIGEDICSQRGPMISPEFLREYYAPTLRRGLEPLLEVGCRPVWHCDGNVRPILDMLLDCGIQGLQGF